MQIGTQEHNLRMIGSPCQMSRVLQFVDEVGILKDTILEENCQARVCQFNILNILMFEA